MGAIETAAAGFAPLSRTFRHLHLFPIRTIWAICSLLHCHASLSPQTRVAKTREHLPEASTPEIAEDTSICASRL